MLATGNSQLAFLDELVEFPDVDWERVRAFHMDEYVGLAADASRELPALHARAGRGAAAGAGVPLPRGRRARPGGGGGPLRSAAARASARPLLLRDRRERAPRVQRPARRRLRRSASTSRSSRSSRRRAASRWAKGHFATIDDVPTHAITVTIPALLRARRVLVIVPEARKAKAVRDGAVRTDHDRVPGVDPAPAAERDAVPRRGLVGVARVRSARR